MRRRTLLKTMSASAATMLLPGMALSSPANTGTQNTWRMPDEGEPHARTWMAFGASRSIWGAELLPEVQRNLASIALAIAQYEPVSMLVRDSDLDIAKDLMGSDVDLINCPIDDLWVRDTGPIFVVSESGGKEAIDFNFNGWGDKQRHDQDAQVARFVADVSGVPLQSTELVLEGGAIEVDGHGTAIITESCVLIDNRNPGWSKAACESELKALLGLDKIVWLPGIRDKDITDGHTDFYARFAAPGKVVAAYDPDPYSFDHAVTQKHLEILRSATDAAGSPFELVVLETPQSIRPRFANDEFAAGYINFYVCNGAVIAPEFGDAKADGQTREHLQALFPSRDIIQLNIDGIAAGGGGIHCATQQEPLV